MRNGLSNRTPEEPIENPDFVALAAALKPIVKSGQRCASHVLQADGTNSLPAGLSGMKYVDAAHLLSTASDTAALRAVGLYGMARCLEMGEEFVYEGKSLGAQELCLEALQRDPRCGVAYCRLGYLAYQSAASALDLPDGRTLNQRQLYLEA